MLILYLLTWFYVVVYFNSKMATSSETSGRLGTLGRTNECCGIYSEACLELCKEVGVKAIDLWTAIQQQDDWLNVCFT